MSTAVCSKCVKDKHLKQIAEKDGVSGQCSVCNKENNVLTVAELGKLLQTIIRENYDRRPEMRIFGDYNYSWLEPISENLDSVVRKVLGQYFDFHDDIVQAVTDIEQSDPTKKYYELFDDTAFLVERPMSLPIQMKWENALYELKYSRRFFCFAVENFFAEIFEGVDQIQYWNNETKKHESVVTLLQEDTQLYRARICDSPNVLRAIYDDPFSNAGPPPPSKARAGRMNAEGVVVLYGSTDPETCLAEMRPPLGGTTAVIALKTTKILRLLNFKRLSKCYGQLSYFQPNYADELERFKFLRFLERRISKPIVPGDEAEYLITQTMTEYLAHIDLNSFDGIIFSSAQRSEGINVVLFAHQGSEYLPAAHFPIAYVDESLKFFETKTISYTHQEKPMRLMDDLIVPESYPSDELNVD